MRFGRLDLNLLVALDALLTEAQRQPRGGPPVPVAIGDLVRAWGGCANISATSCWWCKGGRWC